MAIRLQNRAYRSGLADPTDKSRLIEIPARTYVPRKLASDVRQIMAGDDVISARSLRMF